MSLSRQPKLCGISGLLVVLDCMMHGLGEGPQEAADILECSERCGEELDSFDLACLQSGHAMEAIDPEHRKEVEKFAKDKLTP